MKITLHHETTPEAETEIREYLQSLQDFDPNCSGMEFEIERGESQKVDGKNQVLAAHIDNKIDRIIEETDRVIKEGF